MDDPKTPPQRSHGRKTIRPSLVPRDLMEDAPELARAWKAQVITLLPDAFPGLLGQSLTGRALQDGLWQLETVPLREFGEGKHRNDDNSPAAVDDGLPLLPDGVAAALDHARARNGTCAQVIYLRPCGRLLT